MCDTGVAPKRLLVGKRAAIRPSQATNSRPHRRAPIPTTMGIARARWDPRLPLPFDVACPRPWDGIGCTPLMSFPANCQRADSTAVPPCTVLCRVTFSLEKSSAALGRVSLILECSKVSGDFYRLHRPCLCKSQHFRLPAMRLCDATPQQSYSGSLIPQCG